MYSRISTLMWQGQRISTGREALNEEKGYAFFSFIFRTNLFFSDFFFRHTCISVRVFGKGKKEKRKKKERALSRFDNWNLHALSRLTTLNSARCYNGIAFCLRKSFFSLCFLSFFLSFCFCFMLCNSHTQDRKVRREI